MSDRILIVMPTRGRPWSALEAIASVMKNAGQPNLIEMAVCQDKDDSGRLTMTWGSANRGAIETFVEERMRFVEFVNHAISTNLFQPFGNRYDWVAWLDDDTRYLTPGWDDLLREHQELVVYGPDGYQNERLATHPFVRAAIPKALGQLLPSELTHYCPDVFIHELGQALGSIAYDPRIKMEHLHPDAGKGVVDQTYADARKFWDQDHKIMAEVARPRIPEMAAKVSAYLEKA